MLVNHKRVLRLMQADSPLAIRRHRFVPTTDSRHQFEVFLNVARRMELLWILTAGGISLMSAYKTDGIQT
jgi:putative transposase